MPLISVIIPAHNCSSTIMRCVRSLLCQKFRDYEIIIIENGSTDDTYRKCVKEFQDISNIVVKHVEYSDVSKARNLGIKLSQGMYVTFVDDDDYVEECYFEKIMELIDNHPNVDCFTFCLNLKHGDDSKIKNLPITGKLDLNIDKIDALSFDGLSACDSVFKKDIITAYKLKFPDTPLAEDMIFKLLYYSKCGIIMFDNIGIYNYVRSKESTLNCIHENFYKEIKLVEQKFCCFNACSPEFCHCIQNFNKFKNCEF